MVQESSKIGIKFKPSKIKILIGNCSKEEALERIDRYQEFFSKQYSNGKFLRLYVNMPIGTDEYTKGNCRRWTRFIINGPIHIMSMENSIIFIETFRRVG